MQPSALLTDYYQLTMAYAYWQRGMHQQEAVFHMFFRRNPVQGDYVIAAGLRRVIDFLQNFQFTDADIEFLAQQKTPVFSNEFLKFLKTVRFTGDIDAVPEGSVVFANEPLLRIKAPIFLCQLLETPLINFINFSSAVTSMASRMRVIAEDDRLLEFGLRRAQGPDGGMTASYASFLGGFDATSNVLAAQQFGIPVTGTMTHSWIMAFDDELTAFSEYARLMPENVVLLVDTYDTLTGIDHAITVGKQIQAKNIPLRAVRLDSGELSVLSRAARQKLDDADFFDTKVIVSGDLTEERMLDLKSVNAPIDGWGVGTHLSTSYEQPALDMVYKLGAIQNNREWNYKLKLSDNNLKTSDPGILQVRRYYEGKRWLRDVIYHLHLNSLPITPEENTQDLLQPIFKSGTLVYQQPSLLESREFCMNEVAQFQLSKSIQYVVERDLALRSLKKNLMEKQR